MSALAQGQTITEASRTANYSSPQAGWRALQLMKQRGLATVMTEAGLGLDKLFTRLRQSLDAKEVEVRFTEDHGFVYSKPLVAHDIRLRAEILQSKLLGIHPTDSNRNSHVEIGGPTFNLVIADPGRAAAIMERLANQPGAVGFEPRVDEALDQDEGRAGPAEPVRDVPEV